LLEILDECLGKGSWDGNKCVLVKRGSRVVAIILYAPFVLAKPRCGVFGGGAVLLAEYNGQNLNTMTWLMSLLGLVLVFQERRQNL
jgi:hypothetical protein